MNKLYLSKEIYSAQIIKRAIGDFQSLTTVRISENEKYYIIEFYNCKYGEKRTMAEYENYAIDLLCKKNK